MKLLPIEHDATAYRADFGFYGTVVAGLSAALVLRSPAGMGLQLAALAGVGLLGWSAMEYALHRFVLHGLQPFKRWHVEHHRHPAALIGGPTLLSAGMFALVVVLPSVLLLGAWRASAVTLGVLVGYLLYAAVHHALHQGQTGHPWLLRRMHAHARHHHLLQPCCFGVTTGFWDWLLRTAGPPAARRPG